MTRTVDDVLRDWRGGVGLWQFSTSLGEDMQLVDAGVEAKNAEILALRAERDALLAAVTWRRPIASAPQDGTKILVRQSFSLDSEEAVSAERGGWATDDGSVLYGFNAFDEWLPVPGAAERHAAVIARARKAG